VFGIDGTSRNNNRLDAVSDSLEIRRNRMKAKYPFPDNFGPRIKASFQTERDGSVEACHVKKVIPEFHADDARHILSHNPSGPGPVDNSEHFRPEMTIIRRAALFPGQAERLARKSTCAQGDAPELPAVELPDVMEDRTASLRLSPNGCFAALRFARPRFSDAFGVGHSLRAEIFAEDFLCIIVNLAERDRFETGPPRRQREPADPAK
jgi:hypothetical protein